MKKLINKVCVWVGGRLIHYGLKSEAVKDPFVENDDQDDDPTFPQIPDEIDYVEFEGPWNGLPTVCVDFDGVIHLYTTKWSGAGEVSDGPTFRMLNRSKIKYTSIDWLTELVSSNRINVAILSSRNSQKGGIKAMKAFLMDHGMDDEVLRKITFPEHKPPAHVMIDDRCMTFNGQFFSVDKILNFKTWQR